MKALKFLIIGFFVKTITGFDDTITNIPIIANITKTRIGKIAFSIGSLLGIFIAIAIAIGFSALIKDYPHYRYATAGLVFLLAIGIYFDIFVHKARTKAEKKLLKMQQISAERFAKLLFIGILITLATALDDIIAYIPIFSANNLHIIFSIIGIITATIAELILVIYFAEKLERIRYKKEIATFGLIIFGILILLEII